MECLEMLDWFISRGFCIVLIFSMIHVITAIPPLLNAMVRKTRKQESLIAKQIETVTAKKELDKPIYTKDLLELITSHITNEVQKFVLTKKQTSEGYNIIGIDTDIEKISTKVFHFFKSEIYNSEMSLINPDGIMEYIINTTRVVLIQCIEEYLSNSKMI